jgi:hypothetical protein
MLFYLVNSLLANICNAHISMSYPISRRNQLSKIYRDSNNVDYDLRTPLYTNPNNFTFPCKGFPVGPSTTTYKDNSISVTLEGTAVHGGGHCQFGISYDNKNFLVLKTVLNSCLLDSMTYTFNLPDNAPGNNLIVFWTWVNRIGNREYYMECADVTVNNMIPFDKNKEVVLQGKELLILNILNYPIVPEWEVGAPPSVDGRNLFENRKDISLNINEQYNQQYNEQYNEQYNSNKTSKYITETTQSINKTSKYITETTHSITKTTQSITKTSENIVITPFINTNQKSDCDYEKLSKCDQDGLMVCYENGFYTCANNKWIYRDCSAGTKCKQLGTSILCDFK